MEKTTEKKNGHARTVILILILLILIAAAVILNKTDAGYFLKCHISKDPRMNCEVVVQLDGAPCALTETQVTGLPMGTGEENRVSDFVSDPSGCTFRCSGGEYGDQPFQLTVPCVDGKTAVIPVRPIVASSWEMSDVRVVISVDSEQETYSYQITLRVNDDMHTNSGEAKFDDETGIKVSNV